MPVALTVILGFAFAGALAAAVRLWLVHVDESRRDDLRAVAARRGWSLTLSEGRLGRAGRMRLAPKGGLPWTVESPSVRAPEAEAASYDAAEPRWAEGTLLAWRPPVAGALPPGEEDRRLAERLRPVPAPPGLVALADGDPGHRVDLADLSRVLEGWAPPSGDGRDAPVMVLSPEGLRLRLGRPIRRAAALERFVDLALDLTRIIGP